jgi:hypothetical protein
VERGKARGADGLQVEMCIWAATREWQNCKYLLHLIILLHTIACFLLLLTFLPSYISPYSVRLIQSTFIPFTNRFWMIRSSPLHCISETAVAMFCFLFCAYHPHSVIHLHVSVSTPFHSMTVKATKMCPLPP